MSRIIIDSDILIDSLRCKPSARKLLIDIGVQHEAFCSAISIGEVIAGMKMSEREETYKLLSSLRVIPVSFEIAERAGELKAEHKSHSLQLDDCLIAATSLLEGDFLCTRNKKHYPMHEIRFFD